jgi:hypothetical protein
MVTTFAWTMTIILTVAAGINLSQKKVLELLANATFAAWGFWVLLHA